jgi:hypothetical protein
LASISPNDSPAAPGPAPALAASAAAPAAAADEARASPRPELIDHDRWPGRPAPERDRSAGIEYIILGLVLLVGATFVSERVRRLLWLLYDPFVIFVLVLVFAEYLVLKARDRTYALEREIELMRRKRLEAERRADDAAATIEALLAELPRAGAEGESPSGGAFVAAASAAGEDEPPPRANPSWEMRARGDLERLRERLRGPR